jgi:uncharacterized protein YpuA (DUF1002 family)
MRSTMAQAGLSTTPNDMALSSASVTCTLDDVGLSVHTDHIDSLSPVTYATALLVAGARQGALNVVGPGDQTVSGESALVGALKSIAECSSGLSPTGVNTAQGLKLARLTQQLADQTDAATAGRVMSDTVHATKEPFMLR